MNEVLADLYLMTGNAEYRTLSQRFSHKAILTPLAAGHDQLDGLHANTQIPKIVGFERVYEATGDSRYHDAAVLFWKAVALTRSFATGGHGDNEHFFPMAEFDKHVFSAKGSETCGQHNMLKLTRALFLQDPQVAYADYYERTLYN
ncbi:beta-L-arabinofuranosidase domain-containing protein, partial [Pseudomonas proteolytica]|uniref:beta-L-arabinofuranosidase domain-containing protein n=1 Tax=Pseudomonas proteolytica TaxID=219574 RepID=UPI0030EEADDC